MKRHGEDAGYGNMGKRQRGDGYAEALAAGKFEMRMLIPSKSAGGVIGKSGDNIKRLRAQVLVFPLVLCKCLWYVGGGFRLWSQLGKWKMSDPLACRARTLFQFDAVLSVPDSNSPER
jgi:hypothetical protein